VLVCYLQYDLHVEPVTRELHVYMIRFYERREMVNEDRLENNKV